MSNAGLEAAIKNAGGKMLRTAVGDKNVIDEMLRERLQLWRRAERPSDFPRLRHDRRRPGGRAANSCGFSKPKNQPLSQLAKCWTRFPQLVTNVKVREKKPFDAARRREPARGRRGKGIVRARRTPAAALFRHGTQSAPARGRPRRRGAEKMVRPNLRRDPEADWRLRVHGSVKISGRNWPMDWLGSRLSIEPGTGFSRSTWPSAKVTTAFCEWRKWPLG